MYTFTQTSVSFPKQVPNGQPAEYAHVMIAMLAIVAALAGPGSTADIAEACDRGEVDACVDLVAVYRAEGNGEHFVLNAAVWQAAVAECPIAYRRPGDSRPFDPNACAWLGDRLATGALWAPQTIDKAKEQAHLYVDFACNAGSEDACDQLATQRLSEPPEHTHSQAEGCAEGDVDDCVSLVRHHCVWNSCGSCRAGQRPSLGAAADVLDAACDAGDVTACEARSDGNACMWRTPRPEQVQTLRDACADGRASSCARLGRFDRDGVAKERACLLSETCGDDGLSFRVAGCEDGNGADCSALLPTRLAHVPAPVGARMRIVKLGCSLGEVKACDWIPAMEVATWPKATTAWGALTPRVTVGESWESRLPTTARKPAQSAAARCDDREATGCLELAGMYSRGAEGLLVGSGLQVWAAELAAEIWSTRCEQADLGACTELATRSFDIAMLGSHVRSLADGLANWPHLQACNLGNAAACTASTQRDLRGFSDHGYRSSILEKACAGGDQTGCDLRRALGNRLAHSPERGEIDKLEKNCKRGKAWACARHSDVLARDRNATEADIQASAAAISRACSLSPDCGVDGLRDFQQQCELGQASMCSRAATYFTKRWDNLAEAEDLQNQWMFRACEVGNGLSWACGQVMPSLTQSAP